MQKSDASGGSSNVIPELSPTFYEWQHVLLEWIAKLINNAV